MAQRQWVEQRPLRAEIDYNQLLWRAIENVVNAPMTREFESRMVSGVSITQSQASEETIELCVRVLRRMIPTKLRDEDFNKKVEGSKGWEETWESIIDLLLRKQWFEQHGLVARIN